MARSKTYQMLMKISGDSSSLKKACEAASEHLDTLGNAAKAAGKVAATALAGIGTAAAGIAVAATSVYTEHEKAANSLAAATGATGKELENLHEKQELEQLISHLSHQTKTPISNLKICIELLREHPVLNKSEEFVTILQAQSPAYNCESTKQLREFLDIMESQTEKLDFLIQGMIKMSRLETGMIKIQASRLNLQTTIGRAVSEIVPKAEKKQIRLYVNCNPNIQVRHDGKWTEEAIFNILDNAVKYTETGGSIRITVTKQEIFTQIAIRDTGKGIAPLRHAEIFTRFYREPEVHDQEGIGIGLYLAREIIELQSGYIQVRSEEGKGAEFQICLLNSYEK